MSSLEIWWQKSSIEMPMAAAAVRRSLRKMASRSAGQSLMASSLLSRPKTCDKMSKRAVSGLLATTEMMAGISWPTKRVQV